MQLLPFGMYAEEVQDTLQETDVPLLNFTLAGLPVDLYQLGILSPIGGIPQFGRFCQICSENTPDRGK